MGTGVISFSEVLVSDDFLCSETRDLEAAAPDFIAVREGTRRPRGRFSESKIAMVATARGFSFGRIEGAQCVPRWVRWR